VERKRNIATHCKREHPFTKANTYIDGKGCKRCKQCIKQRNAGTLSHTGLPMRKIDGTWQRKVDGKWQSLRIEVVDPSKLRDSAHRRATRAKAGQQAAQTRTNIWSWS